MSRNVFFFIAEFLRMHEAIRASDFFVVAAAVHFDGASIRHHVERASARLNLGANELHREASRRQPLRKVIWIGPDLKHRRLRNFERTIDDEPLFARDFFLQELGQSIPC